MLISHNGAEMKALKQAVAYLRKSTKTKQQHSFSRQKHSIELWAKSNGYEIVECFPESLSGKLGLEDRPQLQSAFATDLPVVVSSIDRLSRDVSTGSAILGSKKVIVADLGMDVDSLILNILLSVAQKEREMISARIVEGMARAKERGSKVGNPNLGEALLRSNEANRWRGQRTLNRYEPMIREAQRSGHKSVNAITGFLNLMNVKTRRGKEIYPLFVRRLLSKMEQAE